MKHRIVFFVFFILFFSISFIGQEIKKDTTRMIELPGIEPIAGSLAIKDLIPADLDLRGKNLILTGYIKGSVSGGATKIQSNHGYINIGPQNTSWAHIYTDRPRFIFNKPIFSYNGVFSSYSNANLYLKTSGTTRMTILKGNGNVGIGIANPSAALHIYKSNIPNFKLQNSFSYLEIGVANNNGNFATYSDKGDVVFRTGTTLPKHGMVFFINDDNNDGKSSIRFMDQNRVIMGIYNNAAVRINGKLFTKEMHVKTNVWSDFVFDDNYNLITIEDLAKYINKNKHLPDVPTEKEVKEKGINVAEMNAVLLQKVEELTLYLIEQDNKIKKMEKEIEELKKN